LTQQQFTPTGELLFRFLLIPLAENAQLAGVLAISIFTLRYFARRGKMTRGTYLILFVVIVTLLSGIVGVANHTLRYGGTDLALVNVFFFWSFGGLITALTGSFIPFAVVHSTNNLLFDIQNYFSSDATGIFFTIIFIAIAAFLLVYFNRRKKKDANN